MRTLALLGACTTLSLALSFQAATGEQGVNPAALIPLLAHKSIARATTLDPLKWSPDESTASISESSSSSSTASSISGDSDSRAGSTTDLEPSSAASTDGSVDDSTGTSTLRPGSSIGDDVAFPAPVLLPPAVANAPALGRACAGTPVSVESVLGVFCVSAKAVCSGDNARGLCPGAQPGLPDGSHCAEIRDGVYGCRPGPKSALGARFRL